MPDSPIIKTDQGAINARILAREAKADFRRIEAASLKVLTHLTSAEAKRMFVRMFSTLQLNSHFISVIARTRLDHADIEKIEAAMRKDMEAAADNLNKAIDDAEALFKAHGISSVATYDAKPLEIEVGLLSSNGRRFLELINKMDQLMPLLQTLEIHEVLSTQAVDVRRAAMKRQIRAIANSARRLATGLRRRMNAMAAAEANQSSPAEPVVRDSTVADEAALTSLSAGEAQSVDLPEPVQPAHVEPVEVDDEPGVGNTGDNQDAPSARRSRRSSTQPKEAASVEAEPALPEPEPTADGGTAAGRDVAERQT